MFPWLSSRARALKNEAMAIYLAAGDARTPWYARAVIWFVVAYMFSPIDLIPDFIPVLGYLDDLLITPTGLALAIRLIPAEVLVEARESARQARGPRRSVGWFGAAGIALAWIGLLAWGIRLALPLLK
ncbi:MAG: YkvA family protein [Anaerolineae bacterium]